MNKQLLHDAVKKKGITNEAMAELLGVSRGSYQARLNGKVQFSIGEVLKIKDYLELTDSNVLDIFFD